MKTVPWYRSLRFLAVLGLFFFTVTLISGVFIVMGTRGKTLVAKESARLIEESGNRAVAELETRLRETAALTRSLAAIAETMPRSETSFKQILPAVINFQRDQMVAGGGVWPEPYAFDDQKERRSFFWGRDARGQLVYFDDYNQQRSGYHREEWYVAARYTTPGTCSWSRSYMDPFSYQPMVTCTVGIFQKGTFWGNATIDLKLEGLQEMTQKLQSQIGGYVFILDRDNKFITFPKPELVKRIGKDERGKTTQEFILISEFAQKEPKFAPLAEAVARLNQNILTRAYQMPTYNPEIAHAMDQASPALNADQTELLAGILLDPLQGQLGQTHLRETILIPGDVFLQQPAMAFIFHVPGAYWKLVIVKPVAAINANAVTISQSLGLSLSILAAVILVAAYILLNRLLITPLARTTHAVQQMGDLVAEQEFEQLDQARLCVTDQHEIGLLMEGVNTLATQVLEQNRLQKETETQLREQTLQVQQTLVNLQETQTQLIQSEKMSSLGQLVSGVAHEINNPVNFIHGNLIHAHEYLADLFQLLDLYETTFPQSTVQIQQQAEAMDLNFLKQDLPKLLSSMQTGTERIRGIVQSLRNFSRLDEAEFKLADLHEGIESTLMILSPQLKSRGDRPQIHLIREYGQLPAVECYPGALNQVFMNLLSNAIDAIREKQQGQFPAEWMANPGIIRIQTQPMENHVVQVRIEDNGTGMPESIRQRIFDPFFTTKDIGKGTGLGLSISYQIVTEKHGGSLQCQSSPGEGTVFTIELPVHPQRDPDAKTAHALTQSPPANLLTGV